MNFTLATEQAGTITQMQMEALPRAGELVKEGNRVFKVIGVVHEEGRSPVVMTNEMVTPPRYAQ